ncbi:MAG: hypothetical protein ACKOTZ_06510, partial [Chloroflexota bacterium]
MRRHHLSAIVLAIAIALGLAPWATPAPARAAAPCRVTNSATNPPARFSSIGAALVAAEDPADPQAPVTLSFTGRCAETVLIGRTGPTTIVGRRTRATGTPTLDATGTGTAAVVIWSDPVTLRGFTITGGTGVPGLDPSEPASGGGLWIDSSSVTLVDMRVTRNEARGEGGAGGGIEITAALGPFPGGSGAGSRLVLAGRTVIGDNSATYAGGGIRVGPGVTVRITGDARIAKNHADAYGGGIAVDGADGKETTLLLRDRAIVTGNDAGLGGGGIRTEGSVTTRVTAAASIQGNSSTFGGGILVGSDGALELAGSVSGNSASDTGG